ncbi:MULTISPECIES: hypothetical protein [Hyphobacterium]|uniref:Cache domain-containing protein n=1 Tax=Hyphobacterium vulgare TaxID=1736751 RepID=A0ABV6ZTQ2_9PROT
MLLIVSVALVIGLVVAGGVFLLTRHNGQTWALHSAERVIAQQAETQTRLFDDVRIDHEAADSVLMQRFAALEGADVDRIFDRIYPLREDGTRRSAPEFFDGFRTEGGAFVEGMGAFIQRGNDISQDEKRILIAAFQTVHEFGAGMRGRVDNFYFFTPGNSLVIYAPTRDDRLEFYRETAPADFDIQALQFAAMMRPENNGTGQMVCTGLENVVYQQGGPAVSSACGSPVRARGVHLGAFGNSIYLHTWLTRAVIEAPEGTNGFVLNANGDVIAHRSLMTLDAITPEAMATANAEVDAGDIRATIMADGRSHGALIHDGSIVSYVRIDAPGWYYVNVRPATAIMARALRFSALAGVLAALMVMIGAFSLAATALRLRRHAARALAGVFEDVRGNEEPALR